MWTRIGGYEQRIGQEEITCTCMWETLQIEKYPDEPGMRKDCKHIKRIKQAINDIQKEKAEHMSISRQ